MQIRVQDACESRSWLEIVKRNRSDDRRGKGRRYLRVTVMAFAGSLASNCALRFVSMIRF
jgi:hypothetical protein